jgi:ABC-type uncharacterized transport system involved in gliding motility auxiliary subunit
VNKTFLSGSSILLLALIFLAVNGIADKVFNRFHVDLTQEGLYTLTKGSREILSKLEQPITLKLYYSKTEGDKYPIVKLYGTRISDLLKEYQRKSNGMITVEVYDPRPDSEDEEWAEKYGITPMDLPSGERVFLGLVALNSEGTEDVIPVFNLGRQEFLEYDITKLVYSLDAGTQPVIGVISTLPLVEGEAQPPPMQFQQAPKAEKPWIFVSQLSKLAEVRNLPLQLKAIPDEITTLFVIHPRGLSEDLRYAIDQYVMKGGNVFIAVDPFCMSDAPPNDPMNPMANFSHNRSSDLNELTRAWGATLIEGKIVGDVRLATPVSTQPGRQENFLAWISVGQSRAKDTELLSSDDVITNGLDTVMLPWSGVLSLEPVENIEQQVLMQTTSDAMLYDEKDIKMIAEDPQALLKKYRPGGKAYPLAVKLSGTFPSSFTSKPGEEDAVASVPGGHIPRSVKPGTVVLIADVDFMADAYSAMTQRFFGTEIVTLLNDNINLVSNIAENLYGNNDLISLRSRGRFTRPFLRVQEIEVAAQQRYQDEEQRFQAALNQANQRLSELQSGMQGKGGETTIMNKALLDEIESLREEKRIVQKRLREVRRALREDKERLGTQLFLFNTFFIPLLLLFGAFLYSLKRRKKTV